MRYGGIFLFLILTLLVIAISMPAYAGCDTPVTLPDNFIYDTPPSSSNTGIVTGEIRDSPSNCPWNLPVVVSIVNASGFTVGPNNEIYGNIGVFYGAYECTPTTHYTIAGVNVTGSGNNLYRALAYYNLSTPVGVYTIVGFSPPFAVSSIGDTVTQDLTIYLGISCDTPTATTSTTTTATTTTATTTQTTTATTTMTTTTTTTTTTPVTTTTTLQPTATPTTAPPTSTTTTSPWPGLGIFAVVMLIFAAYVRTRNRGRKD